MVKKLCIGLILIVTLFILIGGSGKTISESTSENKENKIIIDVKSSTLYGSSQVKIKGVAGWKYKNYKTEIHNDGKNLSEKNFEIKWENNDHAFVTLIGEEQGNEVIEILFSEGIELKKSEQS